MTAKKNLNAATICIDSVIRGLFILLKFEIQCQGLPSEGEASCSGKTCKPSVLPEFVAILLGELASQCRFPFLGGEIERAS